MQVLLTDESESFKQKTEKYLNQNFKDQKNIDLRNLWTSLYKASFIKEANSLLENVLLTEAVCKLNPGIGLFLLTQFACIGVIKNYAGDYLKQNYLKKLISGETIGCFSVTELNAGSDVSMIETIAKQSDSSWILEGHKVWASNGSISDIIILFAQTGSYKDKSGIACFLINSSSKEVEILKDTPKLGIKITPSNEILIKNLKIPAGNQIGNISDGIKIALSSITLGRIYCASQAVGLLDGILCEVIKYGNERKQFGKSILDFQAIKWYVADMIKDLDAARLLLYKAVYTKENNLKEQNKYASMAKYFCTSVAQKHSANAVQILGGRGLINDSYVANAYKDSKVLEIYEGTNEIQKVILAKELELN